MSHAYIPGRKGDKLTVTVERIDGGKLRCTGPTWSDAVVIYPGEALAFVKIERQGAYPPRQGSRGCDRPPPADTPRSRWMILGGSWMDARESPSTS
jgi:hypothetical protein